MRWEKVNPIMGEGPGKRWGHTCNAVNSGRFLYIFGGYGKLNSQTNQVHVFDTVKLTWIQPTIKGISPTPRDSHTCTAIGENLFVFGGTDGTNPLNDLHILNTALHTWIRPTVKGEGPASREGHSAAVVGKRIFIFGGCGKSTDNVSEVYYNDLYIFDTDTFEWTLAPTSGTPPSPRDSHTCSSWKNKIIVIGGEDERDSYLSDVHILDTDTLIWTELRTTGQLLPPRAGHSTVSFGKNLFVFGGFTDTQSLYNDLHMLDIETGIWTKVTTTPNSPSARFSVAGDCLDPIKGGVLVFIGGCNRNLEALDDMHYLHTGIVRVSEQRPEKLSFKRQLKQKCQEENINPVQHIPFGYIMGANNSQTMTVPHYSQPSRSVNIPVNQALPPGKKSFEAKVTLSTSEGYTIETVIDGKALRGFLFLNKPPPPSRKRTPGETSRDVPNSTDPENSTRSKVLKQSGAEERQEMQGDGGLISPEHCKEAAPAAVMSSNPIAASSSETFQVSVNPEPEAVSLNQQIDEKIDSPKSLREILKSGANDMTSSEGDVRTDDQANVPVSNNEGPSMARRDQTNDAPSCNTDVLKPAAAETQSAVCLQNQGVTEVRHDQTNDDPNGNTDVLKPAATESAVCLSNQGATGDPTIPMEEGHGEPDKLI